MSREKTEQSRLTAVTTARQHVERASDALLKFGDDEQSQDLRVTVTYTLRALEAVEERLYREVHGHGQFIAGPV